MTPYISNINQLENSYNASIINVIVQEFVTEASFSDFLQVFNVIKQVGKNIGRIAFGMESRTFPDYPDFTPNVSVSDLINNQLIPLLELVISVEFLTEIKKNQPLKIIDLMDSVGTAIGYCINTNQMDTDKYSQQYFDIQAICDSYVEPLLNGAREIILDTTTVRDANDKLKIADSVSKLIARVSYGMENQFQDKNQDLNGVGTYAVI